MTITSPYSALAQVYDRWTAERPHLRWADFLDAQLRIERARRVLDLCCGTGTILAALQDKGYEVTGLDGSAEMLSRAREVAAPGTELLLQRLPAAAPPSPGTFDAVVCCFDSVNYFVEESGLTGLFGYAAAALREGGLFIFDVNTRKKLEEVFGSSHYGDDLDDFAYVWRNRYRPEQRTVDFLITLFVRAGDAFQRAEEHHVQRWFASHELVATADAVGLLTEAVTDDYTATPTGPGTLRETWVLRRGVP